MNIKHLLAASVVAVAPFVFAEKANAAASDCWWGLSGENLDHKQCDVERLQDESGEYFEIVIGGERIWVDLWVDDSNNPTVATLEVGPVNGGETNKDDFSWSIDADGDVRIAMGRKAFVFRFPDHPDAGTGNTQLSPDRPGRVPVSPAAQSADGLQPGDLSNTPFRF